ncbi:MAG: Co2+/Mg2+ efflux protein ApaG [Pseudohongiellaceae bacterium]
MADEHNIKIEVQSHYLEEQSSVEANRYVFAYAITITNGGKESVKLLTRHWYITDGNNRVEEVSGDGVVGQQPVIKPGESFHYTSGAILQTETGTMQGSYGMISANGEEFRTDIPPFLLSPPRVLH